AAGVFDRREHRPRAVLVGGEPIASGLWQQLLDTDGIAFHNLYGPTEATVDAALCRIAPPRLIARLGGALAGVQVHIVDDTLRPVEPGVVGELCIAGA